LLFCRPSVKFVGEHWKEVKANSPEDLVVIPPHPETVEAVYCFATEDDALDWMEFAAPGDPRNKDYKPCKYPTAALLHYAMPKVAMAMLIYREGGRWFHNEITISKVIPWRATKGNDAERQNGV
jgi:hypothetical protein